MAKRANCRNCKHFIPLYRMSLEQVEEAYCWIHHHRPGERLLGWCEAYNRPVTYIEGTCPRYLPKRKDMGSMKLTSFIQEERE